MFDFITHYSLTFLSAAVTLAMGIILLMLSIPYTKEWASFRRLRSFLAATCLILTVVNFISCMVDQEDENPALLASITLIMSSYQALLFTTAVVIFMRSTSIPRKLALHLGCISAWCLAIFITLYCFPHIFPYVFWAAVAAYVIQLCYYTYIFRKQYKSCIDRLESFYDDEMSGRLRWVRNCFYSALAVGIIALLFSVVPVHIDVYGVFIMLFTVYYVYITGCTINYRVNAGFIIRALNETPEDTEAEVKPEAKAPAEEPEVVLSREKEYILRQALNVWIEQKRFTEKDTNIDDIARELGTSQRLLSAHFTKYEKVSFRAWRNKLRIEEACRLLREDDKLQLKSLNDMVGMGDYSYFYKQFKLATGMSPTEYREKYYHPAIIRSNQQ